MTTLSIPRRLYQALGDGARNNRYDVMVTMKDPTQGVNGRTIGLLCKGASIPGRSHESMDFVYKGRSIPIRGQSAYEHEWSGRFYLSEDHALRNQFDIWIESLDEQHNYVSSSYAARQRQESANGYTRDIKIYQQSFDDSSATAEYTLHNVFPKSISSIELDGTSDSQVLEYQVTFSYSHYTIKTLDAGSSTLVDMAMDALSNGLQAMSDEIIEELASSLKEGISDIKEAVFDAASDNETFTNILNGSVDFFYNPGGWMNDIATSIGSNIGSAIGSIAGDAIKSVTSGVASGISGKRK